MDKNTITGLVLIAILLVGFSFLSRPSKEQLEAQQRYYDSIALVQQREEALKAKADAALANEKDVETVDSTSLFFNARQGTDSLITIQNDVAELTLSTKGGSIFSAVLKEYMEQDKKTPVTLFTGNDVSMNFLFYNKKETIQTKDYYFTAVHRTDSTVTMRLVADSASYIDFKYALHPNTYLVDFSIEAKGMADKLAASNNYVDIEWAQRARQIEKGYVYENRLSELTYKFLGDGTDYLSANKDDEKEVPERLDWIAFKNQFFSSVFIADADFEKTKLVSKMEREGSGYIKDYSAEMSTTFDPTGQKATQMFFYFGPNHYKTLTALDKGREEKWELNRLVYLGWPLIRWVNKWFTINIFDWLSGWGLSMGIVLLLMTLIVKAVVFPATWKTYISSAKMRVLKPKIDEINKKYPKQEDAMKKQQEVMGLYSQYGVSPMGGCLPMLVQFPVLIALFMFVPSAIELRQQSFLWADDLSTYDAFINFPFNIPFLGSHLSLFCLLMTVVNILNSKFMMQQQDTGANPQMAAMKWMTYLMPVMMLFILNSYPSGLNYYYFISTLISVVTTLILRKTTNEEKLLAQLEARKKDPKKAKKTGFAARLEAMQKQQEQLLKERQNKK
ncbi:membrane protein insertase YidC [Bacteroides stercorirosoris]|jgi:YidC/Oxa1 family membrane protein insertase|uniref:Membrane protein insertase YidC n=2 Tax=Bacteroides stercorirosoris TaxID=871324 RepID=A0A1M6HI68_9BACE|nr:membrane protein insertase YidC [Bacteroides stercorirosoris]OKZ14279.1 MAG: membrane protein insertase YidC [Bacteroides oleiciplenus]SHJ21907.1 YidC/Oxa1 family membrane protein insertase [Bacteroides stercorirosoris]